MAKILIVDDLPENLYFLEVLLKSNGDVVLSAYNGVEALEIAHSEHPDLIVSDVLMPVMDGFSLCRECKSAEDLKSIPFVFYTATYTDARDEKLALELGADRFVVKPIEAEEMLSILREVLESGKEKGKLAELVGVENEEVFYKEYNEALIRKLEDKMLELQHNHNELNNAYDATIEGWSRAMDLRDHETEGHTQRVTNLILCFAEILQFPQNQFVHIRRGAMLHDIGKLGVPDSILLKPGPLSEEEWTIMRMHPEFARQMLQPIEYLRPALDIPYCHHERWDGGGYPRDLKGEEIPLIARMFSIVDVWDAFRSDRPYRKAVPEAETRRYIREQSGLAFEPRLVVKFFELIDQTVCREAA